MKIKSINIGKIEKLSIGKRVIDTAIKKKPTYALLEINLTGIKNEEVGDKKHHGGPNRAFHFFSSEHYDLFESKLELADHAPRPWVGENITTIGYTDAQACIGDQIMIGRSSGSSPVVLEVCMPTVRCSIPGSAANLPMLTKWLIKYLRTGFYLRVIKPGVIHMTDTMELIREGNHNWTIERLSDLFYNKYSDERLVNEALELHSLAEEWKDSLRKKCGWKPQDSVKLVKVEIKPHPIAFMCGKKAAMDAIARMQGPSIRQKAFSGHPLIERYIREEEKDND